LTPEARAQRHFNPGNGWVSHLCHEPRVSLAVLQDILAPHLSAGRLRLLTDHKPIAAETDRDVVRAVSVQDLRRNEQRVLTAPRFIDATELGDLLPLTGTEFVTGAEAQKETGEPHAPAEAQPGNQQAFTCCSRWITSTARITRSRNRPSTPFGASTSRR